MKKLFALLLALTMALCPSLPALAEGEVSGASASTWTQEDQAAWDELLRSLQIAAYGGVPGQINILLNDRCVTFPDAVPEGRNGRTMVPLRAAMESMGALVDYDPATKSAVVKSDKISFTHVIGTQDIVLADGSVRTMDVASYAENGRTMVPLRFFSEVLGYDVQWDNDYRMAYLLDRESMIGALDNKLTVLNSWLARYNANAAAQADKNVQSTASVDGKLTLYGENAGETSFALSGSAITGPTGTSAAYTGDLSVLAALLASLDGEADEAALALLGDIDLRIVKNAAEGSIYLGGSTVTAMTGYETGTWFRYADAQSAGEETTVGALVYAAMLTSAETNHFQQTYSGVWEKATSALALFSDEYFTKSGSSYRCTIDLDTLAAYLAEGDALYTAEDYLASLKTAGLSDLDLRITLKNDGAAKCSGELTLASDGVSVRISLNGKVEKTGSTFTLGVRADKAYDLTLTLQSALAQTSKTPDLTLPADATVVDMQ